MLKFSVSSRHSWLSQAALQTRFPTIMIWVSPASCEHDLPIQHNPAHLPQIFRTISALNFEVALVNLKFKKNTHFATWVRFHTCTRKLSLSTNFKCRSISIILSLLVRVVFLPKLLIVAAYCLTAAQAYSEVNPIDFHGDYKPNIWIHAWRQEVSRERMCKIDFAS